MADNQLFTAPKMRYIARLQLEAITPLSIGVGEADSLTDSPIAKDAFGLPYVPGTSLAGVLRHAFQDLQGTDKERLELIFGFQEKDKGQGSRLICSAGYLLGPGGQVAMGKGLNAALHKTLSDLYRYLPQRDHVRINEKGVADAENHGKFDSQLLPRGTRFVFELELQGCETDKEAWERILQIVQAQFFSLGAGTRKGFGRMKVVAIQVVQWDLSQPQDLALYLDKTPCLSQPLQGAKTFEPSTEAKAPQWRTYTLEVEPKDVFIFDGQFNPDYKPESDKYKDDNGKPRLMKPRDMSPKREAVIEGWKENSPKLSPEPLFLILGSSLKGALAHRVAYHYNRLAGQSSEGQAAQEQGERQSLQALIQEQVDYLMKHDAGIQGIVQEMERLGEFQDGDDIILLKQNLSQLEALKTQLNARIEADSDYQKLVDKYLKSQAKAAEQTAGEETNLAVRVLFGTAKDSKNGKQEGRRGNILPEDVFICPDNIIPYKKGSKEREELQHFNHVTIDRFTGGAVDQRLFNAEVATWKPKSGSDKFPPFKFYLDLQGLERALETEKKEAEEKNEADKDWLQVQAQILQAWHSALQDICEGSLPLGAGVMRGHGRFSGRIVEPQNLDA